MTRNDRIIETGGISTFTRQLPGKGPTLVCIHGNSHSHAVFSPFWTGAIGIENPLLVYDLPGHGWSSPHPDPRNGYSLTGYGAHLKALVETLDLEQVILFGFSLGGHIALEAAGNWIKNRVRGLFTVGTPPIDQIEEAAEAFRVFPDGSNLFMEKLSDPQISCIAENISENPEGRALFFEEIKKSNPLTRKYLAESLGHPQMFHSEHAYLKECALPAVIAFGDDDRLINSSYLEKPVIRELLGSRMAVLKECSHLPDWNGNSDFLRLFHTLLQDINDTPGRS